jgi:hypothetical protein
VAFLTIASLTFWKSHRSSMPLWYKQQILETRNKDYSGKFLMIFKIMSLIFLQVEERRKINTEFNYFEKHVV